MRNNSNQKKRHILATILLGIITIGNGLASPLYILGYPPELREAFPQVPHIFWTILGSLGPVVVICCIALFRWKKWGFWGICIVSALVTITELLYGFGYPALIGPCVVLLLYGLLRLGKENSAWNDLE